MDDTPTAHQWATESHIDVNTLMIGFSFSMETDGSFGKYNDWIAHKMLTDIQAGKEPPWVAIQWEIYDALESAAPDVAARIPLSHVSAPPPFTMKDVGAPAELKKWLVADYDGTWPGGALHKALKRASDSLFRPRNDGDEEVRGWLVAALNGFLGDDECWRQCAGVQLRGLVRTVGGRLWMEERVIPRPDSKLGRFQRRRVNRLLVDALCPPGLVSPMSYVSTQTVLDDLLGLAWAEGQRLDRVRVYGDPVHVDRCAKQFLRAAWQRCWPLRQGDVSVVMVRRADDTGPDTWSVEARADWELDPANWRPETAQEWCRNLANWNAYNGQPDVRK